jgi:NADH:ubiquinone reductase (H+-translocating)
VPRGCPFQAWSVGEGLGIERILRWLMMAAATPTKHVVIVGGGFAGVGCALELARDSNVRVTLIDRHNYHQFQPLFYQLATSELGPRDVGFSLRKIFYKLPNVDVKLADVTAIDPKAHRVTTKEGPVYQGDFLVLAAGAQANFFNTPGADTNSFPLYSLSDAERLRSRILALFEDTDRDPKLIEQGALNFVIVGGGATGIEMAGGLADMIHSTITAEYEDLAVSSARICLVERGTTLLAPFSVKAHDYATKVLQHGGVILKLNTAVNEVHPGHVLLSDGSTIKTRCVIWGAGLKAAAVAGGAALPQGRGGRINVQHDLSIESFPGVYALGDFANIAGADGRALPQLGSVAQQSGRWAAKNILADISGKPRTAFHYRDKGIMAMIGKNAAIAEVGEHRHELEGVVAYSMWLGVHLALLTGLQVKVETFIDWIWDYFSRGRGSQLLDRSDAARINWQDDDPEDADKKAPGVA